MEHAQTLFHSRDFKLELVCASLARRRRMVVAQQDVIPGGGQGPQGPKLKPEEAGFSWAKHVRRMTEKQFKLRYRLTFDAFMELLDKMGLRAYLKQSVTSGRLARNAKWGVEVTEEVKLAMCLRFLAGGDPLDLYMIYDVDRSYVYKCVWLCVDAVNACLTMEFPLKDVNKLKKIEAEFRAHSKEGVWEGCCGCIDGVDFAMEAPTLKDVPNPMKYYVDRKHAYCMLCIAICDYDRRFTYANVSQVPTTHDSLAWSATKLGQEIAAGELPAPFFINADAAFTLSSSMITPSGDPNLDDFDFVQSSNRMPIECAFGILIRRFGILHKKLRVRFDRRGHLILACMRLHNYCIDKRIEDETQELHGLHNVNPGRWTLAPIYDPEGRPVQYLDILRGPRQRVHADDATEKTSTRRKLVQLISNAGITRPQLPAGVHRKKKRPRGRQGPM